MQLVSGRSQTSCCIVVLNSCLKLLVVQSGPGIVKSACNNGGTAVEVAFEDHTHPTRTN